MVRHCASIPLALLLAACASPRDWPWPASPCPPGMVYVPGGSYVTGMKPPMPYGVVETAGLAVVDAPEQRCPSAIRRTPGATACWVQTDLHDPVVGLHRVEVEGYCMERYPFPGRGAPNFPDGLTTWDAQQFDRLLSSGRFGPRRLCSFTEYELAVAGPRSNLRFVYGDRAEPERCASGEDEPIGSHPLCRNPETGVYDYGAVVAQWVRLDQGLLDWACARDETCRASGGARLDERRPDGSLVMPYIVAGGTHRVQTRQAPYTPHTFHDHGQPAGPEGCDDWGWDDGVAVCATPDPRYERCAREPGAEGCAELRRAEREWAALLAHCRDRSMTDCLDWGLSVVERRPVEVCPDRPRELGPGQGR